MWTETASSVEKFCSNTCYTMMWKETISSYSGQPENEKVGIKEFPSMRSDFCQQAHHRMTVVFLNPGCVWRLALLCTVSSKNSILYSFFKRSVFIHVHVDLCV